MKNAQNDAGGVTYTLTEGDRLDDVPPSHREIITPDIQEAFPDPRAYFARIAKVSMQRNFSAWLGKMVEKGHWSLVLANANPMFGECVVAFQWSLSGVWGAMVEPGAIPRNECHADFGQISSYVRLIQWGDVGWAGGLWGIGTGCPLSNYNYPSECPGFPSATSEVFANTEGGDQFVHTPEGDVGFISHEICKAYRIGTIGETLDWIFGELLEGREPDFDYSRVK